jgi:hypothetical protein
MIQDVHLRSGIQILDFLPIPDPVVKKAPNPGSGSATLVLCTSFLTKKRRQRLSHPVYFSCKCTGNGCKNKVGNKLPVLDPEHQLGGWAVDAL